MKPIYKSLAVFFVLVLALLPTQAVHASGLLQGRVIFGDNFTLQSGETLSGDLVVVGGNATIEEDATVQGDLVVVGGNLTLDGLVKGTTVIVGGSGNLGEAAVIEGDLVTVGGTVSRAPGARVLGQEVSNIPVPDIEIPDAPSAPVIPSPSGPRINFNFDPLVSAMQVLFTAVAVAALAMLAILFLQPQMERVALAVTNQPLIAGAFGLLTAVLSPVVVIVLLITILLSPLALLAVVVVALAWLFGVIALGLEVGERFTRAINQTWAPVLTVGFGTFLLMLVAGGIGLIPCIGWLAPALVGFLGIGGVALTLFGTQHYPRVVLPPAPATGVDPEA